MLIVGARPVCSRLLRAEAKRTGESTLLPLGQQQMGPVGEFQALLPLGVPLELDQTFSVDFAVKLDGNVPDSKTVTTKRLLEGAAYDLSPQGDQTEIPERLTWTSPTSCSEQELRVHIPGSPPWHQLIPCATTSLPFPPEAAAATGTLFWEVEVRDSNGHSSVTEARFTMPSGPVRSP